MHAVDTEVNRRERVSNPKKIIGVMTITTSPGRQEDQIIYTYKWSLRLWKTHFQKTKKDIAEFGGTHNTWQSQYMRLCLKEKREDRKGEKKTKQESEMKDRIGMVVAINNPRT